jgi:hypothetical protein
MVGTQSEDEKRIKQAIKEGKQLKNEKAAEAVQFKPKKQIHAPERHSFGSNMRASIFGGKYRAPKYNSHSSRDSLMSAMTCFCCFKPGHLTRKCRSANSRIRHR